jgi:polyphosphate kinase 2
MEAKRVEKGLENAYCAREKANMSKKRPNLRTPMGWQCCRQAKLDRLQPAVKSLKPLLLGKDCDYDRELRCLQIELVKLQEWIRQSGLKVVVLFEGRDAAGKGGSTKRITESLHPRVCRVVALGTPTEREKTQWYFQRYVAHLPAAGELVLFDRSWYNRAGVERVMGFCTESEYMEFLHSCPEFERMLVRAGIILVKYWFSVSDEEQERRFQDRMKDVTKRWKLSGMDLQSRARWAEYSRAKDEMFAVTDIKQAPWHVVNAEDKKCARLSVIRHLLSLIPCEDLTPEPITLPPLDKTKYIRPPIEYQSFIPEVDRR